MTGEDGMEQREHPQRHIVLFAGVAAEALVARPERLG
jgi:hypothetical protein